MNSWTELAIARPTASSVSLLWSSARDERVKVVVRRHEAPAPVRVAVAPDCALDAFHHPFLYAGPEVRVAPPASREEVAA